jgi:hypothetical protein
MTKLTPSQASQLRKTMGDARAGRATLAELGIAHDLAASAGLAGCSVELRGHLLAKLSPASTRSVGREVALGVATGVFTHYLLGGT